MHYYILLQQKSVDEDLKWICHIEMVENVSQVLPDWSLQALYFYHPETLLCLHTSISNGKIPDSHGPPILKTAHHVIFKYIFDRETMICLINRDRAQRLLLKRMKEIMKTV